MKKVSWGVLSTAKIGTEKVIPAMQRGTYSRIDAIASRKFDSAAEAAHKLGIPKSYGSYEELLDDNEIDAVYISLPNHMHVDWTIKALKAGKHVLCEKPISMNLKEAEYLNERIKEFQNLKIMEAFMYRFHPQWETIKKIISDGLIGEVRNVHSHFSYYNVDADNIRNRPEAGGGGLLDIGCYCVSFSRFIMEAEPNRVCGNIEYDPVMKTDRLTSGLLEFGNGTADFTCSTQMTPFQYAKIFGTRGRIDIEIPFTPIPPQFAKIKYQTESETNEIVFDVCDQYTIQGDQFSKSILDNKEVPTPLKDGIANMKVLDKITESVKNSGWVII